MTERVASLAKITGGKPEWYDTRRALAAAEKAAGVVWNGTAHVKAPPFASYRLVRTAKGTWCREADGRRFILTATECKAAGVACGPGND